MERDYLLMLIISLKVHYLLSCDETCCGVNCDFGQVKGMENIPVMSEAYRWPRS